MADKIMELWWNTATFASDFLQEKTIKNGFSCKKAFFFFAREKVSYFV